MSKFVINLCYKMHHHERKPSSSIWRVCGTILSTYTHRAPTSEHKDFMQCYKPNCVLPCQTITPRHHLIQTPLSFFLTSLQMQTSYPEFICSRTAVVHEKTKPQEWRLETSCQNTQINFEPEASSTCSICLHELR